MKRITTLKTLHKDIEDIMVEKIEEYREKIGDKIQYLTNERAKELLDEFAEEARQIVVSQLPDDTIFALRSIQPTLEKIKAGTKVFFNLQLFREWGLIKERGSVERGTYIVFLSDFGELIVSLNLNL